MGGAVRRFRMHWLVLPLFSLLASLPGRSLASPSDDRIQILGSLLQGYAYADPDFIRSEPRGTFRTTRYTLMGILALDETFSLRSEVFGESDRYISIGPDQGSSLDPSLMQAAGEAQFGFSTTLRAGISRLPIGLDGMIRDLGLAFRSLLKPMYLPITGLMPRTYRGVGLSWHKPFWGDEFRFDAAFGEMSYTGGYEQIGRFHLPKGSIGSILKEAQKSPELLPLPEEIVRDMGALRLQTPLFIPNLTLVASGWHGIIPASSNTPKRRLLLMHAALAAYFDFWRFQAEFARQAVRANGLDRLEIRSLSVENNIPVHEDFHILADYLLDFPDWSGRRYGSYRHETLLAGLEWIPTPAVSVQASMRWVRGEVMLMRATRLWDWAEGGQISASYTYY